MLQHIRFSIIKFLGEGMSEGGGRGVQGVKRPPKQAASTRLCARGLGGVLIEGVSLRRTLHHPIFAAFIVLEGWFRDQSLGDSLQNKEVAVLMRGGKVRPDGSWSL